MGLHFLSFTNLLDGGGGGRIPDPNSSLLFFPLSLFIPRVSPSQSFNPQTYASKAKKSPRSPSVAASPSQPLVSQEKVYTVLGYTDATSWLDDILIRGRQSVSPTLRLQTNRTAKNAAAACPHKLATKQVSKSFPYFLSAFLAPLLRAALKDGCSI